MSLPAIQAQGGWERFLQDRRVQLETLSFAESYVETSYIGPGWSLAQWLDEQLKSPSDSPRTLVATYRLGLLQKRFEVFGRLSLRYDEGVRKCTDMPADKDSLAKLAHLLLLDFQMRNNWSALSTALKLHDAILQQGSPCPASARASLALELSLLETLP